MQNLKGKVVVTSRRQDVLDVAEYDQQFAVNRRGVSFGWRSLLSALRDGGRTILVSSPSVTKVLENHAIYAGTKAAIAAFARNWTLKLKARRIRMDFLSPASVDTAVPTRLGISDEDRPGFLKMMGEKNAAGRFDEADDLARAAFFHVRRR